MTVELRARYDEVMLWHNDLAAEIAAILFTTSWQSCPAELFDITARPKTIDTLVQKLQREHRMTLDEVQDLAGVRIDADITLDVQTAIAHEIAAHFGDRSRVRDLRDKPHSGYRAVHVWLRLPAGNVEVQIRTIGQSEWANTYERLGDRFGRGIRYNEMPDDELARKAVEVMHLASEGLADSEKRQVRLAQYREQVDRTEPIPTTVLIRRMLRMPRLTLRIVAARKQRKRDADLLSAEHDAAMKGLVGMLRDLRSTLDQEGN